jgi:hypothetical protein
MSSDWCVGVTGPIVLPALDPVCLLAFRAAGAAPCVQVVDLQMKLDTKEEELREAAKVVKREKLTRAMNEVGPDPAALECVGGWGGGVGYSGDRSGGTCLQSARL